MTNKHWIQKQKLKTFRNEGNVCSMMIIYQLDDWSWDIDCLYAFLASSLWVKCISAINFQLSAIGSRLPDNIHIYMYVRISFDILFHWFTTYRAKYFFTFHDWNPWNASKVRFSGFKHECGLYGFASNTIRMIKNKNSHSNYCKKRNH